MAASALFSGLVRGSFQMKDKTADITTVPRSYRLTGKSRYAVRKLEKRRLSEMSGKDFNSGYVICPKCGMMAAPDAPKCPNGHRLKSGRGEVPSGCCPGHTSACLWGIQGTAWYSLRSRQSD